MARTKGTPISLIYEVSQRKPFDARQLVSTKSELIKESTWLPSGATLTNAYTGMITAVAADTIASNNGVYYLKDRTALTSEDSWVKLAEIADLVDLQTAIDEIREIISGLGDNGLSEEDVNNLIESQITALRDEITNKGYLTAESLSEHLTDYAKKDDVSIDIATAKTEAIDDAIAAVKELGYITTEDDAYKTLATSQSVTDETARAIAAEEALGQRIDNITIPETNLDNYYTKDDTYSKDEVDAKVTTINTSINDEVARAKAEEERLAALINDLQLGDTDVDLANYYTKPETNTLLENKADKSSVESLSSQMNTFDGKITAIESHVDTLNTSIEGIDGRVDTTETNIQNINTSIQDINAALDNKANVSSIETLESSINTVNTALGTKADTAAVESLQTSMETKADTSYVDDEIEELSNTVASTYATTQSVTTKAEKSYVDETFATLEVTNELTRNVSAVDTRVDTLDETVNGLNATIDAKVDQAEYDLLVGTVNQTQSDLGLKANQTDLKSTQEDVDTNTANIKTNKDAITEHTTTLNAHSTSISTLETSVDGKADKATTLAGYGITDTYTASVIDQKLTEIASGGNINLDGYVSEDEWNQRVGTFATKEDLATVAVYYGEF